MGERKRPEREQYPMQPVAPQDGGKDHPSHLVHLDWSGLANAFTCCRPEQACDTTHSALPAGVLVGHYKEGAVLSRL